MKKCFFLLIIFCTDFFTLNLWADNMDVLLLKDGNVVHGYIVAEVPHVSIKFKSLDGNVTEYNYYDILGFSTEPAESVKNAVPNNEAANNEKFVEKRQINKSQSPSVEVSKETPKVVVVANKIRDNNSAKGVFFLLGDNFDHSHQSMQLMAGYLKNRHCGYLKLNTNFKFDGTYDSECESTDELFYTSDANVGINSITAGPIFRVTHWLDLYGGLGYGSKWVNWQTISGENYRITDISHNGLAMDIGALLKIKRLLLNAGLNFITLHYVQTNIGVGILL